MCVWGEGRVGGKCRRSFVRSTDVLYPKFPIVRISNFELRTQCSALTCFARCKVYRILDSRVVNLKLPLHAYVHMPIHKYVLSLPNPASQPGHEVNRNHENQNQNQNQGTRIQKKNFKITTPKSHDASPQSRCNRVIECFWSLDVREEENPK